MTVGAPDNSVFKFNKSGWMTRDICLEWFNHFVRYSHASIHNRVLLIMDGHSTHVKNIDVIDKAREVGVDTLVLPPHTTHRLQPLDVAFMGPLKTYINRLLEIHIRDNGRVRIHDLAGIYNLAT